MNVDKFQALDKLFRASSIAVVGASDNQRKFGYMTLKSLIDGGYEGRIFPINPKGGTILGQKAYTSLAELPSVPDLAVVIVPAPQVAGVLHQAGQMGVAAAMVLSAGFREAGNLDLEAELALIPGQSGLRFAGPNIQGINYLPNKMCAMFFPVITTRGPLAIISQSGTITAALSEWAAREGLGICAAVNLGNQTDLCEADYLEYLAGDPHNAAIAMYIEGVKNGPRFVKALARATLKKPVVVLKGGRTEAGCKSAASHTGALAGSHEVFNAVCRQYGAMTAHDLENLYDRAKALATLALPAGRRVLSVSTSGGAGTLGADTIEAAGLTLPPLSGPLKEVLKLQGLSPLATVANPLDLASISAEDFRKTLVLAEQHRAADLFLLNFGDPVDGDLEVVAHLKSVLETPLAVAYLGGGVHEEKGRVAMQEMGVPVYPSPERAMRGLGVVADLAGQRLARSERRPHYEA